MKFTNTLSSLLATSAFIIPAHSWGNTGGPVFAAGRETLRITLPWPGHNVAALIGGSALLTCMALVHLWHRKRRKQSTSSGTGQIEAEPKKETLSSFYAVSPAVHFVWRWHKDEGGSFLFLDPRIEGIIGLPPSDIENDYLRYIHPDDLGRWTRSAEMALSMHSDWLFEGRFFTKDGEVVWTHWYSRPTPRKDGSLVYSGIVINTTTTRMKIPEGLPDYEARNQLELTKNLARIGLWSLDAHDNSVYWDRDTQELHGVSRDAAAPPYLDEWLKFFSADSQAILTSTIHRAIKTESESDTALLRLSDDTHGIQWIRLAARPKKDGFGRAVGAQGTVQDVTRARMDMLEQEAVERELEIAQRQESISRMTSGLAHDFNNIMAAILSRTGLIREELERRKSEESHHIEAIEQAGRRGSDLAAEIMRRANTRSDSPIVFHTESGRLLTDTLELSRVDLPESVDISISSESVRNLFTSAQNDLLMRALQNFIINARDAFGGHKGRIRLHAERAHFENPTDKFRTWKSRPLAGDMEYRYTRPSGDQPFGAISGIGLPKGDFIRCSVEDDGPGISPDIVPTLFDPGFTTKGDKGSGIGLSHSLENIAGEKGFTEVESRQGKGTRFSLVIPITHDMAEDSVGSVQDKVEEEQDKPATKRARNQRPHVLIGDDEAKVGQALSIRLERLGYECAHLTVAEDIIEMALEDLDTWDVIILDEVMPGMNGHEISLRLRAADYKGVIVLYTGYVGEISQDNARRYGIDVFLHKPIRAGRIHEVLKNYLIMNEYAA